MAELNENVQGQETETEKTYTQAEVDELLQRETDRRVTSALHKQEAKNQAALKEAQKLSEMNESQKYQYQLEQREAAIAEKEKQLALAEMTNTASKILNEKGLSLDLVKFVVDADGDVTNENIKSLEKAFKASVKAEVERRLGTDIPRKNLMEQGTVTKEQFLKMGIGERQKLATEQPEVYKALSQH